jgi:hypothetical protein
LTYDQLVRRIKRCVHDDIETRFKIGELLDEAINGGATWPDLARDVGMSQATLRTYRAVFLLFGPRRIPKTDETTVIWSHYANVAHWRYDRPAAVSKLIIGGTSVYRQVYKEHNADLWVPPTPMSLARSLVNDMINARIKAMMIAHQGGIEYDEDLDKIVSYYTELRDAMDTLGVQPRRRLRKVG